MEISPTLQVLVETMPRPYRNPSLTQNRQERLFLPNRLFAAYRRAMEEETRQLEKGFREMARQIGIPVEEPMPGQPQEDVIVGIDSLLPGRPLTFEEIAAVYPNVQPRE